jgi:Mn-dependent DtxR family transcriptional regulator
MMLKGKDMGAIKASKINEFDVLMRLLTEPKSVYEMAKELNVKPPYVSKILKKLKEKGCVEKNAEGRYIVSSKGCGHIIYVVHHLKFINELLNMENQIEELDEVVNKAQDEFTKNLAKGVRERLNSSLRVDRLLALLEDIILLIAELNLKMGAQLKDEDEKAFQYLDKELDKLWFLEIKQIFMSMARIISSFNLDEWKRLIAMFHTIRLALYLASDFEERYNQLIKSLQKQYSEGKDNGSSNSVMS